MEQSSSSVQRQSFQIYLLRTEFQLSILLHDDEKDARKKRSRQDCDKINVEEHELDFNCLDKFFIREKSDCVEKSDETQQWREDKKKFKTRRSVEFSRKAERCIHWRLMTEVSGKRVGTEESGIIGVFRNGIIE